MEYIQIVCIIVFVIFSQYLYRSYKSHTESIESHQHYKLVSTYLLNHKKVKGPMIWIHLPHDMNARHWESFGSRSSADVNQPYLQLTIKSIVDHCETTCTIAVIDDDAFKELLPDWSYKLSHMASPEKENVRQLGLCQLLYMYGGMIVPPSFLCMRDLKPMFNLHSMFVGENVNTTTQSVGFVPYLGLMGCRRKDPMMEKLIGVLQGMNRYSENNTDAIEWCKANIPQIDASYLGVKTMEGNPVEMPDLLESGYTPLRKEMWGIIIPMDKIINSTKYAWFARMSTQQVLRADLCISRYMVASYVV